jgi:hypothetical protein
MENVTLDDILEGKKLWRCLPHDVLQTVPILTAETSCVVEELSWRVDEKVEVSDDS